MKNKLKLGVMILAAGIVASITVSAMTITPYANRETGGVTLRVVAWFNSGYKTTSSDATYGVQANKYIRKCWVRIEEGSSYNKIEYSKAYTRAEAKQGQAELSKPNNPFVKATLTWGWEYN